MLIISFVLEYSVVLLAVIDYTTSGDSLVIFFFFHSLSYLSSSVSPHTLSLFKRQHNDSHYICSYFAISLSLFIIFYVILFVLLSSLIRLKNPLCIFTERYTHFNDIVPRHTNKITSYIRSITCCTVVRLYLGHTLLVLFWSRWTQVWKIMGHNNV